jgi:long-chain acyl-CoA synthetase
VPIYETSSSEQVAWILGDSGAVAVVVETASHATEVADVRDQLTDLQHVWQVDGGGLADLAASGEAVSDEALEERRSIAGLDDLATVIYTSGTTGPPKGVMISHYNVVFTAEGYLALLGRDPFGWRAVSYLPMAHIAERMSSHYLGAIGGLEVTTCPETSELSTYLAHVRPQTFFGVPRVWEKMYSGVNAALAADAEKAQKFTEALAAAEPIDEVRRRGGELTPEQQQTWDFLDQVAFKGIREMLGLDQLDFAISGAAPIPPDVLQWFRSIGVPLSEIYGMSESTGPMTWDPYLVKVGTVGRAFPGCEVKLLDDGEVVCRGGNVFEGYLNDPEKTRDALDDDKWLHSGDIGEFDDEGYLRIVDRKKELIITAGGKNISPANLEAALKSFPLIGQAAVIGDKRPFISALLVLDAEVAPAWAKQHGIASSSLAELATNAEVLAEVEANVREANAKFSQVEQVKKWTLLGEEWLPDSEELTPTMKLKRRGINEKYADEIEALYAK